MQQGKLTLRDGREMAYTDYGVEEGSPLVFCHGSPGSEYDLYALDAQCAHVGARVVAPSRPGYGDSTPHPAGSLSDWADDFGELLDALGIEKCHLLGFSGGGPFAMSCAQRMPDRIEKLGLLASMGPWNQCRELYLEPTRALWEFGRDHREQCEAQLMVGGADVDGALRLLQNSFGKAERDVICIEPYRDGFKQSVRRMIAQGYRGLLNDIRLQASSWPFSLEEIQVTTISWHGGADALMPVSVSEQVAVEIPNCRFKHLDGEGHYFWMLHWERVIGELIEGTS